MIHYRELSFKISPTGFKHTGLFPEQAVNWDFMADKIRARRAAGQGAQPLCLHRRRDLGLRRRRGRRSATWTPPRGWWRWARENAAAFRPAGQSRSAGLWTTAKSLWSGRSGGATAMTASSWTRPPTAAAPGVRCGSWRIQIYDLVELCAGVLVGRPAVFPAQLLHHRPFSVGHAVHFRGDGGEALSG